MVICICRYPLMVTDKRFGSNDIFLSMPLEVIDGVEVPVPDMEVVTEKDFSDKMATYMKVKWQDFIPPNAKRYNVNEHIVMAGCPESELSCDSKSIFAVFHPIEEWNDIHMIDLKDTKK